MIMNKQQAIKALDEGKTLTHNSFTEEEWVRGVGLGMYEFEDGCKCNASEFWAYRTGEWFNSGWSEKI